MSLVAARSLLFVPGDRPDRFPRAAASRADVVVLDLEDAVSPAGRPGARAAVRAWLDRHQAVVRINGCGTDDHDDDLRAVQGAPGLLAVMLSKAATSTEVASVADATGCGVLPLVETASGLRDVHDVAAAPATVRLVLGTLDLAADLDCEPTWESLLLARSTVVLASRAAGRPGPVDGVSVDLHDETALRQDVLRALTLGLTGKLCLHPSQVEATHEALRPTPAEIGHARAVLALPDAVATHEGRLVDAPVRTRALAVLARAGQTGE